MLSALFSWFFFLFDPFEGWFIPPIEPQPRLRYSAKPWNEIITGVYGTPPLIKIHDREGKVLWKFERDDVDQDLPDRVHKCLHAGANDATELKYLHNGTSVAAVYSGLIVVVNRTPGSPGIDKKITFALCRDHWYLSNAHTLESLPNDLLAVGTTGSRPEFGILVYNTSKALPLEPDPPIVQNITGIRAIHALIWDEQKQLLWAAGTDIAADGSDNEPAHPLIRAFPWDNETQQLVSDDSLVWQYPGYSDQSVEWGLNYGWWAGAHDLVPIPNERKFIVSDDVGLHFFDAETGKWSDDDAVIDKYMPGFEVTSNDRHGYNTEGTFQELPKSDLKSFNIAPDGSYIYVQTVWKTFRGNHTSLVVNGTRRQINLGDEIYRSRWFGNIDGWPKPL
ncbi:hypothetical protein NUU61_004777 [Penicillium alfredii]|uniref:Uncharacterized protein n=1 Tax=Penicillium alfredii TaxID=1506179 RepID=A0A9W9F883_9EURO|nr:uncharacterized protein NUU61_004777 [Penicillium alfredii]KAJ5095421.1 hypothetical protein NUU61_004777 [Penicillium alfredii]